MIGKLPAMQYLFLNSTSSYGHTFIEDSAIYMARLSLSEKTKTSLYAKDKSRSWIYTPNDIVEMYSLFHLTLQKKLFLFYLLTSCLPSEHFEKYFEFLKRPLFFHSPFFFPFFATRAIHCRAPFVKQIGERSVCE